MVPIMSFVAHSKHYLALFLIAIGGCGIASSVLGIIMVVVMQVQGKNENGELLLMSMSCSILSGLVGGVLLRGGLRLRRRAIDEGSTAHLPESSASAGYTSRSGAPRPSFLDRSEDEEPRLDHRGITLED
jgi:hypothetical protein